MKKNNYKKPSRLLLLLTLATLFTACDNKPYQVKTLYPWLEGNWKGEMFFHAEDRSFPAELKYHDGKLQVMFKDLCKGKVNFSKHNSDKYMISVECNNGGVLQILPHSDASSIEIEKIDSNRTFKLLDIQYYNLKEERFLGTMGKE